MTALELRGVNLHEVLAEPGSWTTVYTDGPQGEPPGAVESRMRSLKDRLGEAGVPDDDAEAVLAALPKDIGLPAPSTRWLLVREGEVVADEGFAAARRGPERVTHGAFPEIAPLLRHRGTERRILVVETGRDGAELTFERLGRAAPEQVEQIEGEGHPITKVSPGGWSQARFQRSVEEVWQHTQSDVADAVDRIVRERRPEHVFVTGDAQARGLLLENIEDGTLDLVVEVDADTRADGADDSALLQAIDETVSAAHDDVITATRDRAAEQDARNGASGLTAVVGALQQAQVDTLLLDERMLDDEETLLALPAAPWVALAAEDTFEAGPGTPLPAAEALVRAAMLTDAAVLFIEDEPAEGEPRSSSDTAPPLAVLRWPEASITGDAQPQADASDETTR
ncbi:Vms1/Ankzf1 family peptidyl-tRNA hydrolase [Microbacterium sp.]|uniref:baeRF2 domain-containing protein n=1 Tax=Microbacterium sp. TaxID=51671 RepID=UPI002810FECC|nr:Vms1/Ankzf1 family peptidyl-tRNA hydrolase [Microbacterium sp.]